MKRWKPAFGCVTAGAILLTQTCWLLCLALAMLIWSALKVWQLKRQGVPEELVWQMTKRYGKAVGWIDVFRKGR